MSRHGGLSNWNWLFMLGLMLAMGVWVLITIAIYSIWR